MDLKYQDSVHSVEYPTEKKIPRSVEALLLFCCLIIFGSESFASTGSSWSQQSEWGVSDPPAHKSVSHSRDQNPNSDVAPFAPGSHNLALDLGQVFLMGDLNKYSDSLGTQLHYTYGVSDMLAFDASLGYSQHSNGKFSSTSLLSGIRLNLSWYDKIIPYAVAGLGFYRPNYEDPTASPTTNTAGQSSGAPSVAPILFGLHLGPGIDLALSRNMFFGAAVTFHTMFNNTQSWANGTTFSAGGSYVSFFLHVGATF